ncbi:MAG: hypothetical protein J7M14_00305 [Planctomycetes bacterium]|nr:hypothetical protein [Planctomycetota bacterium]
MKLQTKDLQVNFDTKTAAFDVVQKRGGARWTMDRHDTRDLVVRHYDRDELVLSLAKARTVEHVVLEGGSAGRVVYRNFPGVDSPLSVTVLLSLSGGELTVELDVNDSDPNYTFESLYYPRSFMLGGRKDAYWIFPCRGGALIAASYKGVEDGRLGWRPSLKCHGAVQGSCGFLCLWETPWDTYLPLVHSRKDGPRLFTRLRSSLNRFAYTRRLRFVFRDKTDYADLIRNVYRPWAMRRGYIRTLRDKTAENANVADLAGGLILHQLIAYVDRRNMTTPMVTFAHAGEVVKRIVKETGVTRGCYHLDGWCRQGYDALHPDVFPPLAPAGGVDGLRKLSRTVKRLGMHFGLHDNYLLFFADAERYRDNLAVIGPDLQPHRDTFRPGGLSFTMSPSAGREFIIANYLTGQQAYRRRWTPAGKTYGIEFCYLDQYMLSGGSVEEDFNPRRPLSRKQFIEGLMENIRIMREEVGCVTSSEHMFDFAVPMYDVNGNRSELMPNEGVGLTPVPLWNLAFHECMAVTNALGNGSAARDALALTIAALTGAMLHHNVRYGDNERQVASIIAGIKAAAPLRKIHKALMYRQCTSSRLLAADGSRQVADYEGVTVEADLNACTVQVSGLKKIDGKYNFADICNDQLF